LQKRAAFFILFSHANKLRHRHQKAITAVDVEKISTIVLLLPNGNLQTTK
jgi:hypothetical protein